LQTFNLEFEPAARAAQGRILLAQTCALALAFGKTGGQLVLVGQLPQAVVFFSDLFKFVDTLR
jgi:hypothetical protein